MSNCPFCRHHETRTHQVEHGDNDYWAVICLNCEAEGPLSATQQGAERLWANRGTTRHCYTVENGDHWDCVCGEIEGKKL